MGIIIGDTVISEQGIGVTDTYGSIASSKITVQKVKIQRNIVIESNPIVEGGGDAEVDAQAATVDTDADPDGPLEPVDPRLPPPDDAEAAAGAATVDAEVDAQAATVDAEEEAMVSSNVNPYRREYTTAYVLTGCGAIWINKDKNYNMLREDRIEISHETMEPLTGNVFALLYNKWKESFTEVVDDL